ncbi:MAG TPA: amidohydrolase family protein [Vicinamibacterales bacterium]|nr:amidohydrolase family protein [Vicinamibacterales bacterium]
MRFASTGFAIALALGAAAPERFETILRNGTIVDGSGLLPYRADVALAEGRIARIGNLSRAVANVDLDVEGLYVSPGFINIHSHPMLAALARAENMLTQGVTTEILNADGSGAVDLPAQLERLAAGGLAVNVGGYIGFNGVWSNVVGLSERRPSAGEIERMRGMIATALQAGAWGVSAGLDYKPAYFARTDEVVGILSVASPWRTNFNNHDRVTPETKFSSAAGIAETLKIAQGAGLLGVVTHMKVTGREQGSAATLLGTLTEAGRRGHYAAADAYPYLAGMTALGALIIPPWAQDGGREALLERFADPAVRARIVAEAEQTLDDRFGGSDVVYLPSMGKPLSAVMTEMSVPAGEAIVRLLEQSNPLAILRFGVESDLRQILQHPDTSIACDCGATTATATHPRNYGSFPRVLGRYVREEKVLTWEDAVRKMTALPAATIGLVDRGYLAHGMTADVTVFDPATVVDHATYESPAVLSEGIRHVFVNGVLALRDGKVTGAQGGRVLKRGTGMPSRPMTPNARRRLEVKGDAGRFGVRLDLSQQPGARHARGSFRVDLPNGGGTITATEFGVLQVMRDWAAFTAQAKFKPEGVVRPITVILDRADPLSADAGAAIVIEVEGARAYRGTLPAGIVKLGVPGS